MTFAAKLNDETPQSIWDEQESLGGRIILTIPFDSDVEDMQGFISTLGKDNFSPAPFPVLTFCVAKPTGGAIVSTIVFPSADLFLNFIDKIQCDAYASFERQTSLIEN